MSARCPTAASSTTHQGIRRLTPRERNVLALIGKGLSNRSIADALNLTEGTVKGSVSAVLEKLADDDCTHAALFFNRHTKSV